MKCSECQTDNPEKKKFCYECGARLSLLCPQCGAEIFPRDKFCSECGQKLDEAKEERDKSTAEVEEERKQVTVLFSDVSGYTAMTERFDPEDIKEIMSRIFGEIVQIIYKYEGFIERIIGDAVMAVFGLPRVHEDDPVRAIRAAREIHYLVENMSPDFEEKLGQPLSMHTGINTGLVVTGEVDLKKGTHGITGDTINIASRLENMALAGEILVGLETYRQAEGYFTFVKLEPIVVKGKTAPLQAFKVVREKERPVKVHRLSGMRGDFIGREAALAQLHEAVKQLSNGEGTVLSIYGDAGTGKSRLIEEFRDSLDLSRIRWVLGHAYPYSQSIPYFTLIDLFSSVWQIKESDPPEKVKEKIEINIDQLMGKGGEVTPYLGSLYALDYPEIKSVSPELWKSRLKEAVKVVLSALAENAPMVICLEDIHWADLSSLDLLKSILLEFRSATILLCVYRGPFALFTDHQINSLGNRYQEIKLQDFSSAEAGAMVESLLKTKDLPQGLRQFVWGKAEGNPFYLEEVINTLVDSGILIRDDGGWQLTRALVDSDIPATVQGIIYARVDLLENGMKRILQEASVIGRTFLCEILARITQLKEHIDECLSGLEQTNLIRKRTLEPNLEYIFKHALTHEAIYHGLLRKERQEIHKRIASVIEKLFEERLSEFYETLAYHFEKGGSIHNAIYYLMKSGEKSLNKYAVDESHQYFKKAFDIMAKNPERTRKQEEFLMDLLIKWAFVFHYRGDFKGLKKLLLEHEGLARSLNDQSRLGMFYTQFGLSLYQTGKTKEAYACLIEALELGEKIGNKRVIGYACSHLSWLCPELGRFDEAIDFGKRGQEISGLLDSDEFLFFNSLSGIGMAYYYKGDTQKTMEVGKGLLHFARERNNIRSLVLGHSVIGCSQISAGDFPSAIASLQDAIKSSEDPWFSLFPMIFLSHCYILGNQFDDAEDTIEKIFEYSQQFGTDIIRTPAYILMGVLTISKGNPSRGLKILHKAQEELLKNERKYVYATAEGIIGKIYLQIVKGVPFRLSMAKNIGFLIKNVPFARRKAEVHLNNAVRLSEKIGAKGTVALASLDLGLLYKAKGKKEQARVYLTKAIEIFEQCQAEKYLKQAQEKITLTRQFGGHLMPQINPGIRSNRYED